MHVKRTWINQIGIVLPGHKGQMSFLGPDKKGKKRIKIKHNFYLTSSIDIQT